MKRAIRSEAVDTRIRTYPNVLAGQRGVKRAGGSALYTQILQISLPVYFAAALELLVLIWIRIVKKRAWTTFIK